MMGVDIKALPSHMRYDWGLKATGRHHLRAQLWRMRLLCKHQLVVVTKALQITYCCLKEQQRVFAHADLHLRPGARVYRREEDDCIVAMACRPTECRGKGRREIHALRPRVRRLASLYYIAFILMVS
mmetsp:Transcript_27945/g.63206  ORF Transcript_27945/g.63206 Transcript_27945/m.63206 type:complete len:127 (-) Transcript_27945:8-388(-)